MAKFSTGCLAVLVGLALAVSLLLNLGFGVALAGRGGTAGGAPVYQEKYVSGASGAADKIVLVDLSGLIAGNIPGSFGDSMVDDIELQLRQAARDASVKGVILRIDSPGGEVTASDEIYHLVSKFRDTSGKPVLVYMEALAASGGYYSAMGGSYVMAHPLTLTGSIGVILETFNVQDLLGKVGVKPLVIKSGKMKDLLSPYRDATPEEVAFIQGMVNETYDRFVGVVAKERKIDEAKLRNGIADGRVFSGRQAQAIGLVDGLGYFDDAVRKERELAKTPDARVVRYAAPFDFSRALREIAAASVTPFRAQIGLGAVSATLSGSLPLRSGRLYYLPASAVGY